MRIDEIDKNLRIETDITEPDLVWLNAREAPFVIHGVMYDAEQGCFVRLPQHIADSVSEGVADMNHHTAGGRVRFRTDSRCIAIRAIMETTYLMPHITLTGQSGFDLYRRDANDSDDLYCQSFMPPMGMRTGYSSAVMTDGRLAEYTINFPLYDGVKELYIALKKDAVLEPPVPYRYQKPIVYYGSSITQGGCASRPGNSYEAILSRRWNTDHINLGFFGSCRAEPEMAKYLAGLDMSIFVCDYDYNCLSEEYLWNTHMPLYRTVRGAKPELPIIFIPAPTVLKDPDNFSERRRAVRATYDSAIAEGDRNVYYIDGAELFAGACWDSCTVDGVHPNDLGFYRMAMRIEQTLGPIVEKTGIQAPE